MSTLSAEARRNGRDETAEVDISGIADVSLLRYANVLLLRAKLGVVPALAYEMGGGFIARVAVPKPKVTGLPRLKSVGYLAAKPGQARRSGLRVSEVRPLMERTDGR
jgi:hypothetical protein